MLEVTGGAMATLIPANTSVDWPEHYMTSNLALENSKQAEVLVEKVCGMGSGGNCNACINGLDYFQYPAAACTQEGIDAAIARGQPAHGYSWKRCRTSTQLKLQLSHSLEPLYSNFPGH